MKGLEVSSWGGEGVVRGVALEGAWPWGRGPGGQPGAHLQAHHVDQGLVGDVDLTQHLCDGHPGDQQVERHKEGEDGGQPGDERTLRTRLSVDKDTRLTVLLEAPSLHVQTAAGTSGPAARPPAQTHTNIPA